MPQKTVAFISIGGRARTQHKTTASAHLEVGRMSELSIAVFTFKARSVVVNHLMVRKTVRTGKGLTADIAFKWFDALTIELHG